MSGKSHCSQNVCLHPNGPERKIKFQISRLDPRGYSGQASFKWGLVIIASGTAIYLPGNRQCAGEFSAEYFWKLFNF